MLVLLAVVTFVIALDPPKLLGIFGQVGVYGIVAASCAPILFGILFPNVGKYAMGASALTGIGTHLTLFLAGKHIAPLFGTDLVSAGFANPGVTAAYGLIASAAVALPACIYSRMQAPAAGDSGNELVPEPAE
jgi:SSS family solute:Na+ symporter/sodium/pantothenate symporter